MDSLSETALLKFNVNTLKEVRKEVNVDHEGVLKQMVNNFEEWVRMQKHFKKKTFDRCYLEIMIINSKGSVERAKKSLDKLCTLKTLLPHLFSKHDVKNELSNFSEHALQLLMPKLLPDNYRLYIIKILSTDFTAPMLLDFHRMAIMLTEYRQQYDYSQGVTAVLDCRDINIFNLVTKIDIMDLRNQLLIIITGYSTRIKRIHLLSSSKAIDTFIALLKQVLSAKIANRIHVHNNVDTLYEFVPKEYLPEDLGGTEMPMKKVYENTVKVFSEKENISFFKEIAEAGTNEELRLADSYNNDILGMPGSFRTLSVD